MIRWVVSVKTTDIYVHARVTYIYSAKKKHDNGLSEICINLPVIFWIKTY